MQEAIRKIVLYENVCVSSFLEVGTSINRQLPIINTMYVYNSMRRTRSEMFTEQLKMIYSYYNCLPRKTPINY